MECELLHDAAAFAALQPAYDALHAKVRGSVFLEHAWLDSWWRTARGLDEMWLFVVRSGVELRAVWPLALGAPRSGSFRANELKPIGDSGAQIASILCAAEDEAEVGRLIAERLLTERGWDFLEAPLSKRALGAVLEKILNDAGVRCEVEELWGRALAKLGGESADPAFRIASDVNEGLATLERLRRRELGDAVLDEATARFVRDVVPRYAASGKARVGLYFSSENVWAADLVLVDRRRHVQLLRGFDPDHSSASVALAAASVAESARAGAERFVLYDDDSPLKAAVEPLKRLRMWNRTPLGRMHRGLLSLKEAVKTIDRIRDAAPEVARRAVAKVASYTTLHLYRGELFVRDFSTEGKQPLEIKLFQRSDFDAMSVSERVEFLQRLDLQESYCRQKWSRGDMVVLALKDGRAAGIVWCARVPVFVPDIGREVRPVLGECYIHDVYVAPEARGQKVAPAMLEFLARELRSRDIYRAWALIERSNTSSTRAFEKAAYASVADVTFAKMGLASNLTLRPPDPEARAFLGL